MPSTSDHELAGALLARCRAGGLSVATAESLTGGLIVATLTAVPGASDVVRGGLVAYATDVKAGLLGVDADLLAQRGAVDPDVAVAMAVGIRGLLRADVGLACTGVAGPTPQDGAPVGEVHVAVAGPDSRAVAVRSLRLPGDREQIRLATVGAVLRLALDRAMASIGGD